MLCYALEKAVVLAYLAVLKGYELGKRSWLFIPARAVFDQDGFRSTWPAYLTMSDLCCQQGAPLKPVSMESEAHGMSTQPDSCRVSKYTIYTAPSAFLDELLPNKHDQCYTSAVPRFRTTRLHRYSPRQSFLNSTKFSTSYRRKPCDWSHGSI